MCLVNDLQRAPQPLQQRRVTPAADGIFFPRTAYTDTDTRTQTHTAQWTDRRDRRASAAQLHDSLMV